MVNIQLFILIFKNLHVNQPITAQIGLKKTSTLASQLDVHRIPDVKLHSLHKGYLKIFPTSLIFLPFEQGRGGRNGQTVP